MPRFKYRARLSDGDLQAGVIEAESLEAAQTALEDRGATVVLLESFVGIEAASINLLARLNRVKPKDIVVVTRALSVMISASVPITEAVRNLVRQMSNPLLKAVLADVADEVEGGARLSDAMERHQAVFSPFFVNMVRAGETSGQLSEVLEYLADQQEKDFDLSSKIKGAMIYPAFILSAMGIVGFIMMTFVVPKLVAVLQEAKVALPLSTRILILVSGFFENFWWVVLILFGGCIVSIHFFIRTPAGRYLWDSLKLRMPVFGSLYQRVYVVRFARSLSTLVTGGVDTVSALEIVAGVMGNEVWKRLVYETIQEVNDGNSLTTAFERHRFVPFMMNQMLAVGESTGRTTDILMRLNAFYSREIDNIVANLVTLIEPIVLIFLGLGVGAMVSAILLPLYSLSTGAGG